MDIAFDRRRGDGPPLVLLHGIGHRRQAWDPVLDTLAAGRDVITVDLPGFGASPALPPGIPYTIDSVLAVMREMFADLDLGRPHIAGNSLGGLFSLAAADAGLVSSATALSPAGFFTAAELRYAAVVLHSMRAGARVPAGLLRRLAASPTSRRAIFGVLYAHPENLSLDTMLADAAALRDAPGFTPTLRAGANIRFKGTAGTVPITIGWGTRDRLLLPQTQAVRAQQVLPQARFVWLPDCGHVPMSDAPELVAQVLLDGSDHPLLAVPAA